MTWVLGVLIWSLFTKSRKRKRKLAITGIALLCFFSNNFIVDEFFRAYEQRDNTVFTKGERYDIAIVLGGFMTYDPISQLEGFYDSSDRFLHAFRLLEQDKVDRVLLSGGSGSVLRPDEREAELMRKFLAKIGRGYEEFIFERESKNTYENALFAVNELKKNKPNGKYLLITSGYHMPRAQRCFEKVGIAVTPYSVDHYVGSRRFDPEYLFMPSIRALERWNILIHEWVGMAVYWVKGYV